MQFTITRRSYSTRPPINVEIPDDTPETKRLGVAVIAAARAGQELRDAVLSRADLSDAVLSGAVLSDAVLSRADLSGARGVPDGIDTTPWSPERRAAWLLERATRTAARNAEAAAAYRERWPDVPVVENLDARIAEAVSKKDAFDMRRWHSNAAGEVGTADAAACATTHCRAGWAIHFAGEAGYALESQIGPAAAGARIYRASAGYVPNFYADNETALADIQARAAAAAGAAS